MKLGQSIPSQFLAERLRSAAFSLKNLRRLAAKLQDF
jgi:hypothetical protein